MRASLAGGISFPFSNHLSIADFFTKHCSANQWRSLFASFNHCLMSSLVMLMNMSLSDFFRILKSIILNRIDFFSEFMLTIPKKIGYYYFMQTKSAIEINPSEFSHRASIYLLGVASAYHVTPDEALKVILEVVSKHMMPSFAPVPKQGRLTKDDVKTWLKLIGRDRGWLAEQCGVKKTAVDEWFKKRREIPPAKLALIRKLMGEGRVACQTTREEVCHA